MVIAIIILIALGYGVIHVAAGLLGHGVRRSRGHRGNIGWSLRRGPWASWRVGSRTTIYEHL